MLKRLWLVLSVAWTLMVLSGIRNPPDNADAVMLLLPWIAGPVLYWAARFVLFGVDEQQGG